MKRLVGIRRLIFILVCITMVSCEVRDISLENIESGYNPSVVPLFTLDPNFSVWSLSECLNDSNPVKQNGQALPMQIHACVDGIYYRLLGGESLLQKDLWQDRCNIPSKTIKAPQIYVSVLPTRTLAAYQCGDVLINLVFVSPTLINDVDLMSHPINYLFFNIQSGGKKKHDVQIFFDICTEKSEQFCVEENNQETDKAKQIEQQVVRGEKSGMEYIHLEGTKLYLGVPSADAYLFVGSSADDGIEQSNNSIRYIKDFGSVRRFGKTTYLILAYDDKSSVQAMGEDFLPYWDRNNSKDIISELAVLRATSSAIYSRAACFDKNLMNMAKMISEDSYSGICALLYRFITVQMELVHSNRYGTMYLEKNKVASEQLTPSIASVYQASPLFLLFNPKLLEALLNPIFTYVEPSSVVEQEDIIKACDDAASLMLLVATLSKREMNLNYAQKHWDYLTELMGILSTMHEDGVISAMNDVEVIAKDDYSNVVAKARKAIEEYNKMACAMKKKGKTKYYSSNLDDWYILPEEYAAFQNCSNPYVEHMGNQFVSDFEQLKYKPAMGGIYSPMLSVYLNQLVR